MIGEQLQRDDVQDGADVIRHGGKRDDVVGDVREAVGATAGGDGDDRAFARADLLDVVQVFRKDCVIRRDKDRWQIRPDERNDAVLELGARMAFGEKVGDLFQLSAPPARQEN